MKHHRKFEPLIADIRKALADPSRKGRCNELTELKWVLGDFVEQVADDTRKVRLLLDVARFARETTGPGCYVTEEALFIFMGSVVRKAGDRLATVHVKRLPDFATTETLSPNLRPAAEVIKILCEYAKECLCFRSRPRDTFAGMRRGLAFDILGHASWFFDLPEVIGLAHAALRRNRPQEVRGAIFFLKEYFKAREDMQMPEDVEDALLAVADER